MSSKSTIRKRAQHGKGTRTSTWLTVICNSVMILALVACLFAYADYNSNITYEQNIVSITNIARAKANLMMAALDNVSHEVRSAYRYCDGLSINDMLDYLSTISDPGSEYILLRRDEKASTELSHAYDGYSSIRDNDGYMAVRYEGTNLADSLYLYAAQQNGEISYSQSFTNKTDALQYFAIFCGITAVENGEEMQYYLIKPQKESKVLSMLQMYSQYTDLATAICYQDGRYLARDIVNFRAQNFFDYLRDYNSLTLDQRNAIKSSVLANENGAGVLEYKDLKERDCVFAYALCGTTARYVVVSVPKSEFVSGSLLSFFPAIIISFLLLLFLFNIGRLMLLVRELKLSEERERVANMSKSSFLSRMSHEIRTPLNAVIGYNAIAQNELKDQQAAQPSEQERLKVMDCLIKSDVASRHLLSILNDVLDMSAIDSGKMQVTKEPFDFRGLITSLTTVFYSQAKVKDVEFEVIFESLTDEWFIGDQMHTNQILTNLLSNAIKFTLEGGTVTMRIRQSEATEQSARIHFEIHDTGIGMTKEYLERIWMPFEQADASISRRFGGTGLGLSITKTLVELLSGSISVDSELGKGTTFSVDLTFERTKRTQTAETYNLAALNALVVDDDINTCEYIRMILGRCGAKCTTVTSGESALKAVSIAKDAGEHYAVCLIDWRMPGMNGLETIKRLRALVGDELPVIVVTAYDFTEIRDQARAYGVQKFISKPLFQSSLFDVLVSIGVTAPAETTPAKAARYDFGGARVLLAEDNQTNMEIAKTIMTTAGLTVDSAWNGQEAVELFCAAPPKTYFAILMDVHMPVMNGHDAARAIRASDHPEAKTIPIIAMTADAFAENVAEARASGMNAHIAKPIDIPLLFNTLMQYLPDKSS